MSAKGPIFPQSQTKRLTARRQEEPMFTLQVYNATFYVGLATELYLAVHLLLWSQCFQYIDSTLSRRSLFPTLTCTQPYPNPNQSGGTTENTILTGGEHYSVSIQTSIQQAGWWAGANLSNLCTSSNRKFVNSAGSWALRDQTPDAIVAKWRSVSRAAACSPPSEAVS